MPVNGTFISSDAVTIDTEADSIVAPAGTKYAEIWADGAFYFTFGATPTAAKATGSKPVPAGVMVPVYGVKAGDKVSGIKI